MRLSGVYTPIVTPFDDEGAVDFSAFERILDFVIDGGVRGVIPCGSTGEFYALNHEERVAILSFVSEAVGTRVELIAGTNAAATRDVIDYTRCAADLGYGAVMLAPPYYSLPGQDEILRHFEMVLDAVDIPIVLYDFPARAGVQIGVDVLTELARHDNIIGIKESSGDFARFLQLVTGLADPTLLVCGSDDQAFDNLAWGVRSWIAGVASVIPRQHVAVLEAVSAGDLAAGRERMRRILPLLQNMESAKYIQKVKYGCELAGVPVGVTRPPLMPLNEREKQGLRRVYELAVG